MFVQSLRLNTAAQNHKRHNTLLVNKRRKTSIIMIAGMMDYIHIHELRNISSEVLFEGKFTLQSYHAQSLTNHEYSKVVERDKFDSPGESGLRRRGQQETMISGAKGRKDKKELGNRQG